MSIGPMPPSVVRPLIGPSGARLAGPAPEPVAVEPAAAGKQPDAATPDDAKDQAAHPEATSIYDQTRMRAQALQLYFALIHHPGPAEFSDRTRFEAEGVGLAVAVAEALGSEGAPLDLAGHPTALGDAAEALRQLDLEIAKENADKLASYFAASGLDKSPRWRPNDPGADDEVFWAKVEARPARMREAG